MQDRGFNSFPSNMIKLSVNETKRSSLLALTRALFRFEYLILGPKSFSSPGARFLKGQETFPARGKILKSKPVA